MSRGGWESGETPASELGPPPESWTPQDWPGLGSRPDEPERLTADEPVAWARLSVRKERARARLEPERALAREERRRGRVRRRQELACFWTWPLGHVWAGAADEAARGYRRCVVCGAAS
jgi:hypothetical protein